RCRPTSAVWNWRAIASRRWRRRSSRCACSRGKPSRPFPVTTPNPEFQAWTAEVQAEVEAALQRELPAAGRAPVRLHEAMRYAVLGGGKRVRPLLVYAAGAAAGAARQR